MFIKNIILLLILASVTDVFSQEFVYDRFVGIADNPFEKILVQPNSDVVVVEDLVPVPYARIDQKILEKFKDSIRLRAEQYVQEARERNIYLQNPIHRYVFSLNYYGPYIPNIVGHCNRDMNLIYLEEGFKEQTFYHELGHCDFGYSHKPDERIIETGYSSYVMSYNFNNTIYGISGKEVLDIFFDFDQQTYLKTNEGYLNHFKMTAQINTYKRKIKYVQK